jgi:tetratricopeptide (TPR) repeat protein
MMGRGETAAPDIDRGIYIAESVRDTVGLMPAVHFKGFVYSMQGRYDEAMGCFERRLDLAQRTRSPADEAWARTSIGYVLHRREENERAREEYTRAIQLFRANGLERLEITPLIGLGRVESAVGNEKEAIRCYQRAWVIAREVGDRVNEMWATNNLGSLEESRGDLSRADLYQQRAFDLAKELKYPHGLVASSSPWSTFASRSSRCNGAKPGPPPRSFARYSRRRKASSRKIATMRRSIWPRFSRPAIVRRRRSSC